MWKFVFWGGCCIQAPGWHLCILAGSGGAGACEAPLVRKVTDGEEVIITEESGLAIKLVLLGQAPGSDDYNRGKLFDPEGLWEQAKPISSGDIAEVRNEMWRKLEQGVHE